jgi:hypothetical protein
MPELRSRLALTNLSPRLVSRPRTCPRFVLMTYGRADGSMDAAHARRLCATGGGGRVLGALPPHLKSRPYALPAAKLDIRPPRHAAKDDRISPADIGDPGASGEPGV